VRDDYHHGNLRAELVGAALELARSHGPSGVVLREVTRRAGVSPTAAYRHFADRDALLGTVAEEGMTRLAATMRRRMTEVAATGAAARASGRLRALGRAYVEFALAEPGLFEVAFGGYELHDDDRYSPPLDDPYALLCEVLDEGVAAGTVSTLRRPGAEITCWAAVHGFAVLHQRGPLKLSAAADRETALEGMLDVFERGLA